ncbi:MAG: sugar transferase [Acidimicrobiales bacterium]|nr:sugar transferase [Acidimicrobiales bacterium]MCB9392572.1 sugar transferase [Acidimicrobiaceae bacterium]
MSSNTVADVVRRCVDVVVAVVGLSVLSPLLIVAAGLVRFDLGSGVLFRQARIGKQGCTFQLYKFRTMRDPLPGQEGPEYDGERMTRLSGLLRSTSIDELPSLVNLLVGDLSLVGPRPLPVRYWDRYRGDEYRRFEVRPGITGLAQVSGRNLVGWDERLALDVEYVRSRSLVGDLRILLRTVPAVLRRSGISSSDSATMPELPVDRPGRD